MIKLTNLQGFSYYMTGASLPVYYRSFPELLPGATTYIKIEAEKGNWIKCYQDILLRDAVALRADQIYEIQEIKEKRK